MGKMPDESPPKANVVDQVQGDGFRLLLLVSADQLTASVQISRSNPRATCPADKLVELVRRSKLRLSREADARLPDLAQQIGSDVDSVVVAQGRPAEKWKDVDWFIPMGISLLRDYANETVDLHEVSHFINVRAGQALCELPALPNEGCDVFGQTIAAPPCPIQLGDRVALDPKNPSRVLATQPGCVRYANRRLSVEQDLDIVGDLGHHHRSWHHHRHRFLVPPRCQVTETRLGIGWEVNFCGECDDCVRRMCLLTLVFLSVLAQEAPATANRRAKSAAQAMLKQGTSLYGRGEYADALEAFQKAYALYPSPKLLFNIGRANNELRRPVDAIQAFETFLAQASDAPTGMLTEATKTAADLSSQLARLSIECPVVGADIALDGKSLGHAPIAGAIWVVPGRHQVTATSEGAAPIVKKLTLAAAMVETVVLDPVDLRKPSPQSPPDAEAEIHRSLDRREDRGLWLGRTWTWVAAGTAVVAAGGAIVAGAMMKSKFSELDKKCGASAGQDYTGCSAGDIRALDTRKNTANVLWGVSAVALVTAGILSYFEGRPVALVPVAGEHMGLVASVRY